MQIKTTASDRDSVGCNIRPAREGLLETLVSETELDSEELPCDDLGAEGEAPTKSLRLKRTLSVRKN